MKRKADKQEQKKTNKKESELVTKESLSAVCALFSFIALLILFTRSLIFGQIGFAVHAFLTGLCGYLAYPLLLGGLYLSVASLIGKRLVKNRKAGTCIACAILSVAVIIHIATTWSWFDVEGYIVNCFYAGEHFPAATACGWLGGILSYLFVSVTSKVGAVIVFSALTVFFAYLTAIMLKKRSVSLEKESEQSGSAEVVAPVEIPLTQSQATMQPQTVFSQAGAMQQENAYANGGFNETVTQRPQVSLSEEGQAQDQVQNEQKPKASSAFSPFGTPQTMRSEAEVRAQQQYQNSREFLFGATPAENYQKNLIFDPNARVNKRPAVDPTANPSVQSGYTPSYADAYQNAVNDSAATDRPVKIFTNRADDYSGRVYENGNPYELQTKDAIEPMRPIEQPPIVPQEPVEYPSYGQRDEENARLDFSTDSTEGTDDRVDVANTAEQEPLSERSEGRRHDYMDLFSPSNPNVFGNGREDRDFAAETFADRQNDDELLRGREEDFSARRDESIFEEREENTDRLGRDFFDEDDDKQEEDPYTLRSSFTESGRNVGGFERVSERDVDFDRNERTASMPTPPAATPAASAPTPVQKAEPPAPPKPRVIRPYVKVPLDDFDCRDIEPTANFEEIEETKENIIATLEDFNVSGATIASVTNGPTVTRYNVTLPRSIPPKKVVSLDQSIALSLHASGVNIYPNYEDGVVSIEVPNKQRQFVQLGCMLTGDTFVNAKQSSLMFAMGKDVGNRKVYGDISKMIHLLVAGSSGSGKSVFLGSLIVSMIYKYSPEELRLILIDPKKTEFVLYNNLPHLMINEIITDVNKAVQSLNWAIGEMNRRYGLFEQMSRTGTYVVNLDEYNSHVENKADKLPKIVIIIDELADLMLAAKKEIEDRIQNLTQKARAAGIHLIVATQRPSTDVITGVIKSNLSTRIAFAVATDVDSRVILDQSGAQNLLGKGDFLYTMQGINTPVRVQSAFISSGDSQRVVNFIKANNEAYYDETATAYINNTRGESGGDSYGGGDEVEGVYIDALRHVILSGSASISMIQRKCSVGYNKAGKIVEWMEDMGYISSFDGAKARKVLITKEEFESKYGSL